MKLKHLIIYIFFPLVLFSCAQIVPLSGGEKDIEPPKEVKSSPKNGSILFSEKTVTIEFDEFVQLKNISSQLIVSPLMENIPEVLVKGKKLVIKLKDELAPNTTYSLNFGNAISDITENNILPNYKYVFSTGSFIDSLSYSGTVLNAYDLSKSESVFVLLYDQFGDSIPYKELPRYVALTDKEGNFSITNIANGTYKFFAINDINGNYLFDLPNEQIAFKTKNIVLDSSSNSNLVYLFEEENDLQFLDKSESKEYGKIDITFNKSTNNLTITPLNQFFKDPWFIKESNENGDSLTLWLTTSVIEENLELLIKDDDVIIDTTTIKILDKKELQDTSLQLTTNVAGKFNLNQPILITTKRPVSKYDFSTIKLVEDSIDAGFNLSKIDSVGRTFKISYPFKENTSYQLFIPPNAFEDIYNLKNDTVKVNFETKSEADYGVINLNIKPNFSTNYFVQLYKNDKLIKESYFKNTIKTSYKYLLPGNYSLKLIIDNNNDKKWNTGNYLDGLQPEKVIYYEKEIKIRANWDNEINWIINE